MPHIIVKLWPGRTEEQKARLAERIVQDAKDVLGIGDEYLSVDIEEVNSEEWKEKVYKPEIRKNWERLYKKPGYDL